MRGYESGAKGRNCKWRSSLNVRVDRLLLCLPLVASLFDLLQEAKTYLRGSLWGFRSLHRDVGQSLRSTLRAPGGYEVSVAGIV